MSNRYPGYLLSLLLVSSIPLFAAEKSSEPGEVASDSELIDPVPLHTPEPVYPGSAYQTGVQGWVLVGFTVTDEGKVADPVVLDTEPPNQFENAALTAIKKFEFMPATRDGTPVEAPDTRYVFRFQLEGGVGISASRSFIRKYRKINKLLDSGKFDEVDGLLADLRVNDTANAYEISWYWWLDARYAELIGDKERQLDSIRQSIASGDLYLKPDMYVFAVQRAIILSAQQNEFADALRYRADLENSTIARESDYFNAAIASTDKTKVDLDKLINGPELITVTKQIGPSGVIVHPLVRATFSLENIDGRIGKLIVICNNEHVSEYIFEEAKVWNIPENGKECSARITGLPETTFQLVEHPFPQTGVTD